MNTNINNKKETIKNLYDLIINKRKVLNILDYNKNIDKYKLHNFNESNIIDSIIILGLEKFTFNIKFVITALHYIKKISIHIGEITDILTRLTLTIIINILRCVIYIFNEYFINLLVCSCNDCNEKKSYFNIKEKYTKLKSILDFKKYPNNFLFKIIQNLITLLTIGVLGITCMEGSYNIFNIKD